MASPSHKHIVHQDGWKQSSLNVKWRVSRTEDTVLVLALRADSFNGIALPRAQAPSLSSTVCRNIDQEATKMPSPHTFGPKKHEIAR